MTEPGRRNRFDWLRPVRRAIRPIEAAQIRRFGRSALSVAFRTPVLLLHTTGRRSGVERTTPLAFHPGPDDTLFVVGGAGGQTRLPDWVANLRAMPRAAATVDGRRSPVRATELSGDDRVAVWDELTRVWPQIESYEQRAGRPVPVIRLQPTPES